jgi:DNA-binding transcriptional regulator LsrR (DeoR family)
VGRRKRAGPRDVLREAQAAAYLYSQGNDQARIGGVLRVSQAEVSRLLGMARREGWLQTRCVLPEGAVAAVEQMVFADRDLLRARLGREAARGGAAPVRGLRIFHSGGEGTDAAAWDARLRRCGQAAAARLQELLPRLRLAGVAWGATIARLVDGVRQLNPRPPLLPGPVQLIPLTGEPLTFPDPETSSSTLAHRLHEILGGASAFHSLAAVPAFIPAKFSRPSRKAIRQFIAEIAGYRAIFERRSADGRPQEPLADRVDAILTGVGTVSAEISGRLLDDRLLAEGLTKEQLRERVIGDIGGIFLPRAGHQRVVRGINERWVGVRLEHLARCARAAAQDVGRAGVIVLAIGRAKAEVVLECVRGGLVNELVVDHELAQALLQAS